VKGEYRVRRYFGLLERKVERKGRPDSGGGKEGKTKRARCAVGGANTMDFPQQKTQEIRTWSALLEKGGKKGGEKVTRTTSDDTYGINMRLAKGKRNIGLGGRNSSTTVAEEERNMKATERPTMWKEWRESSELSRACDSSRRLGRSRPKGCRKGSSGQKRMPLGQRNLQVLQLFPGNRGQNHGGWGSKPFVPREKKKGKVKEKKKVPSG